MVRQRPAKPCTRVRFPSPPPVLIPSAISSAGERFPDTEEVTGSIPVSRTSICKGQTMYLDWLCNRRGRYVEHWDRLSDPKEPPHVARTPTKGSGLATHVKAGYLGNKVSYCKSGVFDGDEFCETSSARCGGWSSHRHRECCYGRLGLCRGCESDM